MTTHRVSVPGMHFSEMPDELVPSVDATGFDLLTALMSDARMGDEDFNFVSWRAAVRKIGRDLDHRAISAPQELAVQEPILRHCMPPSADLNRILASDQPQHRQWMYDAVIELIRMFAISRVFCRLGDVEKFLPDFSVGFTHESIVVDEATLGPTISYSEDFHHTGTLSHQRRHYGDDTSQPFVVAIFIDTQIGTASGRTGDTGYRLIFAT